MTIPDTSHAQLTSEADLIAQFVELVRKNYDLPEQVINLIASQPGLDEALQVAFAAGVEPPDINAFATGLAGEDFQRASRERAERPQRPPDRGAAAAATMRDMAITRAQPRQAVVDPDTGEEGTVDPVTGRFEAILGAGPGALVEEEEREGFLGGFPDNYRPLVDKFGTARQGGPFRGRGRNVVGLGGSPLYYEWDAWRQFAGKSPEYIFEVKQQFVEAGIIDEDQVGPQGLWRREDAEIMAALMTEANAGSRTWVEVLADYKAFPDNAGDRAKSWRAANPFIAPVFKAPDYASLSTAVRTAFEQAVGRAPKDYELALLADQMRADFNGQHAATVAAARANYEATARGIETESSQSAGTVQDVDPMARLEETVLKLYGPEIERVEDVQENALNVGLMMRNLTGIERAVG